VGSALGWFGLAAWVVVAAWFLVVVVTDRGVLADGETRERGVVLAVHEATADPVVAGGSSETIYYPTLEYDHASGGGPRQQASYCFVSEPPEVGQVVDVIYDALNAPCAAEGVRLGPDAGRRSWPPVLLGLGALALVLSAFVTRRIRAAEVSATGSGERPAGLVSRESREPGFGSVSAPVLLLALVGVASFAASLVLPLGQRGERPPLVDPVPWTSGTGDLRTSWSWQNPGTLLVLAGVVLLVAHLRRVRSDSVIWLGLVGTVVGVVGLVVQQAGTPPGSGGDVVTGAGLQAAAFGLVTLGVALGVDRLSWPASVAAPGSQAAAPGLPFPGALRAGVMAGMLVGFLLAVEVVAYVTFEGWADDSLSASAKLQTAAIVGLLYGVALGALLGAATTTATWAVVRWDPPGRALLAIRLSATWLTAASVLLGSLALVDNHGGWTTTNVLLGAVVAGTAGTAIALARQAHRRSQAGGGTRRRTEARAGQPPG
jgi:hypothetical protein